MTKSIHITTKTNNVCKSYSRKRPHPGLGNREIGRRSQKNCIAQ